MTSLDERVYREDYRDVTDAEKATVIVRIIGPLLAAKDAEIERLANLLKSTRDSDLVETTADRDSWREQARMAQDEAIRYGRERDDAHAALKFIALGYCLESPPRFYGEEPGTCVVCVARRALGEGEE